MRYPARSTSAVPSSFSVGGIQDSEALPTVGGVGAGVVGGVVGGGVVGGVLVPPSDGDDGGTISTIRLAATAGGEQNRGQCDQNRDTTHSANSSAG